MCGYVFLVNYSIIFKKTKCSVGTLFLKGDTGIQCQETHGNKENVGEGFVADFMPVIGIDVHATNPSLSCHPVCTFKGA